jgi:hypothetical protein
MHHRLPAALVVRPRLILASLALIVLLCAAAPAGAAVPDKWVRWVNIPDEDASRDERSAWVRSLDFIGPVLYAASEGDGVFTSPTAVGPWTAFNSGFDNLAARKSVRQIASSGGRLYAATTAGLFRAFPGGSWAPVGQGTGTRKLNMGGIQAIHFNLPTELDIVVGTASSGVLYSSDAGEHWDKASGLPSAESVFHITANPGVLYAAAASGVFASVDQGRSWILASDGIPPSETVLRVAVTPGQPNVLYAATSSGVYKSTNAGVTWNDAAGSGDTALGDDHARALLLAPAEFGSDRVIVGTEDGAWATRGGGIWGQMSPETLVDPDPVDPAPDPLPFGQQILWALGVGFGGPEGFNLMAGTQASGVYSIALQALANTADPTVTPNTGLNVGETVTANVGAWEGTRPHFFTYQWQSCVMLVCTNIAGATAKTYTLTSDEIGKKVRVRVTGRNLMPPDPAVETSAAVPAAADVAAPPAAAPTPKLSDLPVLTPNPSLSYPWGQTFTIDEGTWRQNGIDIAGVDSYHYSWQRCDALGIACADIAGADERTFTTTPADVGTKIAAHMTATEAGATSSPAFVGMTFSIIERTPVNTEPPTIVGDPHVGRVLSSSAGAWTANQPTFKRRWLRCESDGLGCNPTSPVQTGSTYKLGTADLGKRLKLEVTAVVEDPNQDRTAVALSQPSPIIANPPTTAPPPVKPPVVIPPVVTPPLPDVTPPLPVAPTIRIERPRRLHVGARLRVPASVPGFSQIRYRWLRNGKKIKRATRRIYRIRRKDLGKRIRCRLVLTHTSGARIVVRTRAIRIARR